MFVSSMVRLGDIVVDSFFWGVALGPVWCVVLYGFRPVFLLNCPTLFDFINQRHCRGSKKLDRNKLDEQLTACFLYVNKNFVEGHLDTFIEMRN